MSLLRSPSGCMEPSAGSECKAEKMLVICLLYSLDAEVNSCSYLRIEACWCSCWALVASMWVVVWVLIPSLAKVMWIFKPFSIWCRVFVSWWRVELGVVSFLKVVTASAMTSHVGHWSWALVVAVGWVLTRLLTYGEKSTSLPSKGTAFLLY